MIAECFVMRSEEFDIYTVYCMNYPSSVSVLRECMKSEELVQFFRERQAVLSHSLPLETYLLKPVQRIMKYHLLLQELAKHFDKNVPGYEVVEEAIITMTAVAWYINDMKRKQEHAVRLQEIQSKLVNWQGPDLSGFGELVLEGTFRVQRVKKERAFFLFTKMILITKKRMDLYIYKMHIFCCNLALTEHLKDSLSFRVSDLTISKHQQVIQARNQEEKRLWIYYIKRLIVENHPASIPQKAKQVLLENTFQNSTDFPVTADSPKSPWMEDLWTFPRNRRQSEPPQYMYSPGKVKKSFTLQSLGSSSQPRRGRRLSEPAKELQAQFEHSGLAQLKHAGSEGELFPSTISLQSADSICTLESCILEDTGEGEGCEESIEDSPFCLPEDALSGSLSMTDEIMELLSQRGLRAEPMSSASTASTSEEPTKDDKDPDTTACPLSQSESGENIGEAEMKSPASIEQAEDVSFSSKSACSDNVSELRNLEPCLEGSAASICPGSSAENLQKKENKEFCENKLEQLTKAEVLPNATKVDESKQEEHPESVCSGASTIVSQKIMENVEEQVTVKKDKEKLEHSPEKKERSTKAKRDSTLTADDRLLIERIKNYYDTADAGGSYLSKEDSISYIPTGVVKDSILRFNYIMQQEVKKDREKIMCRSNGFVSEGKQVNCHKKPPCLATIGATTVQEKSKDLVEQEAEYKSCAEIRKAWKEKEKPSVLETGQILKRTKSQRKQLVEKGGELVIVEESDLELVGQLPKEIALKKEIGKEQQNNTTEENKGKQDGRQKKEVTCLASDTNKAACCSPVIGLFDADDLCLIENSDKIINKVQLLAKMYSEKIGRMKTQKKNGENKRVTAKNRATEKMLPQVVEESTGERRKTEPQIYGHLMIHETLLHINCVQENGLCPPAVRESSADLKTLESLPAQHLTKEKTPLSKSPDVDLVFIAPKEEFPTETKDVQDFSVNVFEPMQEIQLELDPVIESEQVMSNDPCEPKLCPPQDEKVNVNSTEQESRIEISILSINSSEDIGLPEGQSTVCTEPANNSTEGNRLRETKELEVIVSTNGELPPNNPTVVDESEESTDTCQENVEVSHVTEITVSEVLGHDDPPESSETIPANSTNVTEQHCIKQDTSISQPPAQVLENGSHLNSDDSFVDFNEESTNKPSESCAPRARGVSPGVMDVMQRLQLDSTFTVPAQENQNNLKKLSMATRSSSFKSNTSTAKEFQGMLQPHIKKQQKVVANPGLFSPLILQRKLSRAIALSKNVSESQQALSKRSPITKSRSADTEAKPPLTRYQCSIRSPSPYRNSSYSGLPLSENKPTGSINKLVADSRKEAEVNQCDSKVTQTVPTHEGVSKSPFHSSTALRSSQGDKVSDGPVCFSPGSAVLIAIPCPPPVKNTPMSTVSEPSSRVQSPLMLRSRMFSPPPVQIATGPKPSRIPSFSSSRACAFAPLSFNNLERSSSSSANSTPSCTSPSAQPWSPGFTFHSRKPCGNSSHATGDYPISPRAFSPTAGADDESKFWCSSKSPPGLASEAGPLSPGISTHELTSIHWPDVRELRTRYGPFKTQKSNTPERKYDLRSPTPFRQCKSLDEGPISSSRSGTPLMSVPLHSPTIEHNDLVKPCDSMEKWDSSESKDKTSFKPSYSTTVNIQIGGSGRIASFSNAQVSLTHPLLQAPECASSRKINVNGSTLDHKTKL
ncbi:pleckstrin homology domain-containing family G member 2 isoform X2 [Hyperolius riggenbachi]